MDINSAAAGWLAAGLALAVAAAPPALCATHAKPAAHVQHLCGWISNPTPANWWLNDRHEQWIIGVQGGHQAEGDLPSFDQGPRFWVQTQPNGHGYGCACIDAVVDRSTYEVKKIVTSHAQELTVCRQDRRLHEPKE